MIDLYLNRDISNHERIKMVMMGSFFLKIWKQFIQNATNKYKGIFSNDHNFLAHQTYEILSFLVDSMVYYTNFNFYNLKFLLN